MSKGLRLTEKWLQRGLWLVALVFAAFLIGLGGKIVDNVWDVETELTLEQFIDPGQLRSVRSVQEQADAQREAASQRLEQAEQQHEVASATRRSARTTFDNWLATRQATARPEQDAELIKRTAALDTLASSERRALGSVEAERQRLLDARQRSARAAAQLRALEQPAQLALEQAQRRKELRVFGYRLALTLPLLLIAGWLFARKRKGTYWPFAWGFILFALFAFFVELVPYLPSYGGYVRYLVGLLVTVVVGRAAITALQRYLVRQKESEALPDVQRRQTLRYDTAMARLEKSVCPGCERTVDLKDGRTDFCPHCGIGLFDHCGACTTRKSAFSRFCLTCGKPANVSLAD